jgi:hypothetical protein
VSTTRLFYARALLYELGIPDTADREQALIAVMTGEDSAASWNPMDTTERVEPCTPYNSFGPDNDYHVWNYAGATQGVKATAMTVRQPNMAALDAALRKADETPIAICRAFSLTPWGGVGDVLPLEIVEDWNTGKRDYTLDRQTIVHGSGPWPYLSTGALQG